MGLASGLDLLIASANERVNQSTRMSYGLRRSTAECLPLDNRVKPISTPATFSTIHRTFASQIVLMPVPARYSNVGS
jgi:hypothetical protein